MSEGRGSRVAVRALAAVVGLVVGAGVVTVPAAHAAAPAAAPKPQQDWVVPGHVVAPGQAQAARAQSTQAARTAATAAVTWPAASTVDVDLPSAFARAAGSGAAVRAGDGPVSVDPALSAGAAARARVQVYDHATAQRAGIDGVLLRVARADGAPAAATLRVTVDYNQFRYAYGADYASRLRLVQLPACALQTPDLPGCRGTVLPTDNDLAAGTVSAQVQAEPDAAAPAGASMRSAQESLAAGGTMLAATSGTSGGAGDFGATTLAPSGTWSAGSSSGDFNWNYPLRTPPAAGGPAPSLSLSYSSGSVDGRMAASNNQPSWVGEGMELSSGFIERRYRLCSDDMGGDANNTTKTGDQCWAGANAVLSLAGHSGELIADAGTADRWHLRNDDGTYVRHLTGNTGNGDKDGEWWVVTTTSGTQFWFGGLTSSNAVWNVPVFGNNPNEPCHAAAFKDSSCLRPWRWNLDHVVDASGNTMTYTYTKETNKYARNGSVSDLAAYDRGGYLTKIDYGTRTDSSGPAPVTVEFATADRCLSNCSTHGVSWPDTPWDLECTAAPCLTGSPTFWTTKRLSTVTTKLWTGTGTNYTNVESWTFTHTFPDPGDGTRAGLWLDHISHTGYAGGVTTSTPDVSFAGVQLNNRVDPTASSDHSPAMNWFRVAQIKTETGGRIEITYSQQDCVPGSRMPDPNALQDNALRCYPVKWTPPGFLNPILDYFHKYVVTEVHEVDTVTPGNPTTVTAYEYVGAPAWHYTDDDGIVTTANKTWSVWRGYATVRTREGVGAQQTLSELRYFRGMNGDKLPSGTRSVSLPAVDLNSDGDTTDAVDVPAVADDDAFAGMTRQSIVYNGPSGAEVSAKVLEPWESTPTASRTINGFTVNARFTGTAATHARTDRDGGRAPRTTSSRTTFDGYGLPVEEFDAGDDAVTGDESCKLTDYDRNADPSDGDKWLVNFVSRARAFAVDCTRAKQAGLTVDDVVSDTETFYDNAASITAPPSRGLITRVDTMKDWVSGAPAFRTFSTSGYDGNGRVVTATDVKGNTTGTAYTQNAAGQLVGTTITSPMGWQTVTVLDPGLGKELTVTDPNGRVTSIQYDGLGRTLNVWMPGRDKATQTPSTSYDYLVRTDAPTVLTTRKLGPTGAYVTTYTLYDGLLRPRQVQAARGDGTAGALVTDTIYDTAGREYKTYSPYLVAPAPGTNLFVADEEEDIPARTDTTYDGAGRTVTQILYVRDASGLPVEHSRTTTAYGGDRVDVTPPSGGTATSTVTDLAGHTVETRQYHTGAPTPFTAGSYDATTYTYDRKEQLVKVADPVGNEWLHTFNAMGLEVKTVDPDEGETDSEYDDAGLLTTATDARHQKLIYAYDTLGRRTAVYKDTVTTANKLADWTYDGLANSRGQLTRSTSYVGGAAYQKDTLGFTAAYQPTAVKYTIPTTETGLSGSYTYFYTYLADGSPETSRLPDVDGSTGGLPTETLTYEYTALGQPKALKTSIGNTTYVPQTDYTGYGEPAVITMQNAGGSAAYVSRTYQQGTRLLAEQVTSRQTAPTTIADVQYGYDAFGNVTKMADATSGDNQCFRYDYLRRLTEAWTPGSGNCGPDPSVGALGGPAKYWTSWTFDSNGNRKQQVEHSTAAGVRTTTYTAPAPKATRPHGITGSSTQDSSGTRTASYGYDDTGNTLSRPATSGTGSQSLSWDEQGRLTRVTEGTSTTDYVYDAEGNRLLRRDGTGKTLYLPGQELRYTTSGATKATTRYYGHAGTMVATRTSSALTWIANDSQGTANTTIDAATQAVSTRRQDPYGNPRGTGTGTWPASMDKGFVGGTKEASGLVHLGAREYDPGLGRFVSLDPVVNETDPQRLDGYAYGKQNPINFSDPTGNDPTNQRYVYVDTDYYTVDHDGYRYLVAVDLYVLCGISNGTIQCLGRMGNSKASWWNLDYFESPMIQFVVFAGSPYIVARKALHPTYGPTAPPTTPHTPLAASCPRPPAPQATITAAEDKCSFWDVSCLVHHPGSWWNGNKDWVTGGLAVAGAIACIAATAGTCAVVGAIGWGVQSAGRVYDFVHDKHYESWQGWAELGGGLAIDAVSAKYPGIPGMRLETTISRQLTRQALRNGEKVPMRTMGWGEQFGTRGNINWQAVTKGGAVASTQLAWTAIQAPSSWPPNSFAGGVSVTDPFTYTPQMWGF